MENRNSNLTPTLRYGKKLKQKSKNEPVKSSQLMRLFEEELMELNWSEKSVSKAIHKMHNIENV